MPSAVFNMCLNFLNITAAPKIAGTTLHRRPRRQNQFHLDTLEDLGEIISRVEEIFPLCTCGRATDWLTISIYHPSTVFLVAQLDPPFASFFNDMGYYLATPSGLLVQKNESIK